MCRYLTKLVAWLDRELEPEQMAELEEHLRGCGECRVNVAKYERASESFCNYCDAVVSTVPNRVQRRRIPP